jgi:ABC-type Na+ efflux pump permease subunit
VPADFTRDVLAGEPRSLPFRLEREGLAAEFDEVRVSRAVYSLLADLIVTGEEGGAVTAESFEELAARERMVQLEVRPAGERVIPPTGFEQSIPGTMVMFTLLVVFTSGSVLLVQERNQGLLRRLASSPMSRGSVVLGKWAGRMILATIEVTPEFMQKLALFLPTGWAMDAMHKLVSFGRGPESVLPHIAVMSVAALVLGWVISRRFRFQ